MLEREQELRKSPEVQEKYTAAEEKPHTDWIDVTQELQFQVSVTVCKVPTTQCAYDCPICLISEGGT